jgi:membrane associated rhomboid family serine protease
MIPLKDNIPTERTPYVTIALIAINVFVYFVLQKGGILSGPSNEIVIDWGAIPYEITHPGQQCDVIQAAVGRAIGCGQLPGDHPSTILTLFSSMFMHGSILHLGGNMLFLWIFGNNVEDAMGRVRFLVWYLLAGLAATALQTFVTLHYSDLRDASIPNVGASGAIAGVLGAYFLLLPNARVFTAFFFIIIFFHEIPAVFFLGLWFLFQLWEGGFAVTHPQAGGGVAFFAHIGGFLFGLLTVYVFATRRPLRPSY